MARCLMIPYGDRPGACPLGTLREFRPLRGSNCGPYGPGEWRIGNGGGASGAQNVGAGFMPAQSEQLTAISDQDKRGGRIPNA